MFFLLQKCHEDHHRKRLLTEVCCTRSYLKLIALYSLLISITVFQIQSHMTWEHHHFHRLWCFSCNLVNIIDFPKRIFKNYYNHCLNVNRNNFNFANTKTNNLSTSWFNINSPFFCEKQLLRTWDKFIIVR